jgi:hypothetical protein
MTTQTAFAFDTAVRRPRARASDPETSHDAAQSVERLTEKHEYMLALLRDVGPATDERLFQYAIAVMSESGARTRRSELVAMGLVRDSGKRRKTRSGRNAIVWEAV